MMSPFRLGALGDTAGSGGLGSPGGGGSGLDSPQIVVARKGGSTARKGKGSGGPLWGHNRAESAPAAMHVKASRVSAKGAQAEETKASRRPLRSRATVGGATGKSHMSIDLSTRDHLDNFMRDDEQIHLTGFVWKRPRLIGRSRRRRLILFTPRTGRARGQKGSPGASRGNSLILGEGPELEKLKAALKGQLEQVDEGQEGECASVGGAVQGGELDVPLQDTKASGGAASGSDGGAVDTTACRAACYDEVWDQVAMDRLVGEVEAEVEAEARCDGAWEIIDDTASTVEEEPRRAAARLIYIEDDYPKRAAVLKGEVDLFSKMDPTLAVAHLQLKSSTEFNIVTPNRVYLFRVADDSSTAPRTATAAAARAAAATAGDGADGSNITARQVSAQSSTRSYTFASSPFINLNLTPSLLTPLPF